MSLLEAIVLGIVQGLTEFLPISSTAHLRIVPAFVGWPDPGAAFTAITQLGTMAAVLLYFREDLARIARAWIGSLRAPRARRSLDARLGWYIVLGTIPISVFGLLFRNPIETVVRDLYLISATLIGLGLLLLLAERMGTHRRGIETLNARDGVVVGLAQALALVPGVSRSGATITAGLFLGLDRPTAARFSFLLSIPAVVLSGALQLVSVVRGSETPVPGVVAEDPGVVALVVATALAFVVGYASIAFLLRYLATRSTGIFVGYRIALGVVVLVLATSGVIV